MALAPQVACVLSAGPSPWWRIASGARLRRSRGHLAGRGQSAGPSIPAGVRLVQRQSVHSGPPAARVKLTARSSRELCRAATVIFSQSTGHLPAHSRQVVPQSDAFKLPATAIRPGRRGPGRRAALDSDAGTGRLGSRSDHGP